MTWLRKLMFWRRKSLPRADLTDIVSETLRRRSTHIAASIQRNNPLFQALCSHDWKVEEGQDLMLPGIPWFKCSKCGKRENTV